MNEVIQAGRAAIELPERLEGDSLVEFKSAALRLAGNAEVRQIVLDFDAVTYVDSMGLGTLLLLREKALARGLEVAVTRLRPPVRRLFALANLHRLFHIR